MTIKREIGGQFAEIELTSHELHQAYIEQEHIFDRNDVENYFEDYEDSDFETEYGCSRAEAMEKLDEIACEMRRNIDKYNMKWYDAREEAIAEKLQKRIERR